MLIYLKLFLMAVLWGGTFIAGRTVAQSIEPFSVAFLRFFIASLVLMLAVIRIEGRLPRVSAAQGLQLVMLGMTGVLAYNFFFFSGLKMTDASRASIIVASNPIFVALLSALLFKDRLQLRQIIGVVVSVAGAAIVISRGALGDIFVSSNFGLGEIYIFGCVVSWVTYSLIGKTVMKDLSPLVAVAYSAVIGMLALMFPALGEGMLHKLGSYSEYDWLSIFYLGVLATVIGFFWYYQGVQQIGPTKASQFINFVPISAIILASVLLDEAITLSLIAGTVLVIGGVYLTNSRRRDSN